MIGTFILGNCMSPENGISTYPDNFFGFGIVDPPYAIGASRPAKKPGRVVQKNGTVLHVPTNDYKHKDWDDKLMPSEYFSELHRVCKKVMIWGANYQDVPLRGGRLIWDKLNRGSDQYDCEVAYLSWTMRTEIVYYLWRGMIQGVKPSRDIRIAYKQQGNKKLNEKRINPTQKPVLLYDWILREYAEPGDIILDTHTGSGSSILACENLGFKYVAYEKCADQYSETSQRIESALSIDKLL